MFGLTASHIPDVSVILGISVPDGLGFNTG